MRGKFAEIALEWVVVAHFSLISRLRAAASVYALRAAFGGCAPTRACGRSPEGEAFFLASCPKLRYNRENYVSRKDDTDGKRRYF